MPEFSYKCNCTAPYTAIFDNSGKMVAIKVALDGVVETIDDCVCPYCHQIVVPQTIKEAKKATDGGNVAKLTLAILNMKKNIASNPKDVNSSLALGLFFLMKGGYQDALVQFEKVIEEDPTNYRGYFYSCIAMLGGKKPCLNPKQTILTIEERLQISEGLSEGQNECAECYYLHAFVKYDFYERKYLRTSPSSKELLQTAMGCGLTTESKDTLFEILKLSRPMSL